MSGHDDSAGEAVREWLNANTHDVLHAVQSGVAEGVTNAMPIVADLLLAFAQGVGAEMPTPAAVLTAIRDGVAAAMPSRDALADAVAHR